MTQSANVVVLENSDKDLMVTAAKNPDNSIAVVVFNEGKKTKNMHVLRTQVASTKPGTKVKMIVLRDGDEKKITIVLDERGGNKIAATLDEASESLSKQLKFDYQKVMVKIQQIKDKITKWRKEDAQI